MPPHAMSNRAQTNLLWEAMVLMFFFNFIVSLRVKTAHFKSGCYPGVFPPDIYLSR
jgi:hypothetical protein